MIDRSSRVTFATNIAAPYRMAVWDALGQLVDLHVLVYAYDEPGRGWKPPDNATNYAISVLPTFRVRTAQAHLYAVLPNRVSRLDLGVATVLMQWESPVYWQLRRAARRRGTAVVTFYESTRLSQRFTRGPIARVRSTALRGSDSVLVPGEAARLAASDVGVPAERLVTGFNPVLEPAPAPAAVEQSAGHTFAFVGQLVPWKNVETLLEAFASIRALDDRLVIIGDGELRERLKQRAAALKLGDAVDFRGHIAASEVLEILPSVDTLVMPSTQEVWGMAPAEALAAGCHAVVSDRCGITPSIRTMRGVYVCSPSVPSVAAAMSASRAQWSGHIADPEILVHTPHEFALTIVDALNRALRFRSQRRRRSPGG